MGPRGMEPWDHGAMSHSGVGGAGGKGGKGERRRPLGSFGQLLPPPPLEPLLESTSSSELEGQMRDTLHMRSPPALQPSSPPALQD